MKKKEEEEEEEKSSLTIVVLQSVRLLLLLLCVCVAKCSLCSFHNFFSFFHINFCSAFIIFNVEQFLVQYSRSSIDVPPFFLFSHPSTLVFVSIALSLRSRLLLWAAMNICNIFKHGQLNSEASNFF